MMIDKEVLFTEGLKTYLLRDRRDEALNWIEDVHSFLPELLKKWDAALNAPFQSSRYGLVLDISSKNWGGGP